MLKVLDKRALRAKGVLYSNVHLLRLERAGKFPRRFNVGDNRVGWLEEDVDAWIIERVAASKLKRQAVAASASDEGQAARVVAARRRHATNPAQRAAAADDEASAGTEDRERDDACAP